MRRGLALFNSGHFFSRSPMSGGTKKGVPSFRDALFDTLLLYL
jgi:hypothetical protein